MRRNNPFAESPSDRLYRGAFAAWRKEGFLMSRRAKLLALTLAMLGLLGVATAAQAGNQLYSGSLIIEGFGRDEGYNTSYPTPYFTAIPLGAHCNPYAPYGIFCGTTTIQQGAPLTGNGTAVTDGMGGFTLPLSGLARKTSGSLGYYPPYLRSYTYADLKNQKGTFFAGGGPGPFSFPYKSGGGQTVAKAAAQKGSNQFGGTMQLLGTYQSNGVFSQYSVRSYQYSFDWGIDILGASSMGTGTGMYFNTALMQTGTASGKNTAFPWTTGTVTATASRRPYAGYPNTMKRKGYDNRVPTGQGTIQLVTPLLTHWINPNPTFNDNDSAAIGILRIKFGNDSDGDGIVDVNDECPNSNLDSTVVIEGCDSGVSNTLLAGGCTISDEIQECDDEAKNHGAFRRCVSKLGDGLQKDGVLTGPEKDKILSCGGQKNRPGGRSGRLRKIISWIIPSVR